MSVRSEPCDDYDEPAAVAAASCPTSRKRQRSRSRERAKTGLWGDGQDQLPGRNGMGNGCVASHQSSPPLEPLPETPRSCSFAASPLTRPSPPSKPAGDGGDACSDRLSLVEQEDVARELGHRMAFLSWRGYDESFLRLMDEVVYEDADDEKNDTHFPRDEHASVDFDARATGRVSSSSDGDVQEEEGNSEPCYVPCDPVADRVPVLVAMDEGVGDETKDLY